MELPVLLLALTPGAPLALAVLWALPGGRRALAAGAPWAAAPALLLALHPGAAGATLEVFDVFTGLRLALDETGRAFLLFTALLWLVGGAFARSYHAGDPGRDRFFGFWALTMAGNLGLVAAGDVLTFYVFFALMTFAAYGLVVHRRDGEAMRAGGIYIVMAVAGELLVLVALFTLGWAAGGVPLFGSEVEGAWIALEGRGTAPWIAGVALAGFAVKVGLAPLHLWLPLAHPVAPTAASALLSGAMIKAGLLAWLRFLPAETALPDAGAALLVVGVFTAFYGVVVGLAQDDPKTVLAYSSVSQMGYMAVGTGLLLLSPEGAPLVLLAVILYAVHHGLAKGALFLAVGVVDRAVPGAQPDVGAGEDGGARTPAGRPWRAGRPRRTAVLLGAALPALALAGAPFSSGARAKTALKDALQALGGGWYPDLDLLLLVAAGGTTLLMARFLVLLHGRMAGDGKAEKANPRTAEGSAGLWASWVILVAAASAGHYALAFLLPGPAGIGLPGAAEQVPEATGPLVLAALLAWVLWRRPEILGRIRGIRIPSGDLVVPLERAARRMGTLPARVVFQGAGEVLGEVGRLQLRIHAGAAWLAERELRMARGSVLALLVGVFAAALGALLLL